MFVIKRSVCLFEHKHANASLLLFFGIERSFVFFICGSGSGIVYGFVQKIELLNLPNRQVVGLLQAELQEYTPTAHYFLVHAYTTLIALGLW